MCKMISTVGMSREDWLRLRKTGIGGADAGAICGLNPYSSPMSVYRDKTCEGVTDVDNEAMRQGRDLEDYVAKRFIEATGLKVRRSNMLYRSEEHPFMIADIDRLIVGEDAGLECKTASAYNADKWKDGKVPMHYILQAAHYMAVIGRKAWYIAVVILGQEFKFAEITRDDSMIASLVTIEEALLRTAWDQVLPESAPRIGTDTVNTSRSWNEPSVFWSFLSSYLQTHQQKISLAGAPCDRNTIAVAHQLKDEKFLILPRNQCATAYADYLRQQGIPLPAEMKKWETDLQRAILDWGIQIKSENNNVSWRFNFYRKDASQKEYKVPCLAFPPAQLPNFITDKLTDWFGAEFEQWISPQSSRNEADTGKVSEGSVNN